MTGDAPKTLAVEQLVLLRKWGVGTVENRSRGWRVEGSGANRTLERRHPPVQCPTRLGLAGGCTTRPDAVI